MSNIFLTLDYELFFGSNSGSQEKSIIKPTSKLLNVLDKYNIKATFFVDSGYILKLREYKEVYRNLEDEYEILINQLQTLSQNGHDIQLHIHPHWEDSVYKNGKWDIDTKRYRLHEFNIEEIDDIVYRYKKVLTDITHKEVFAYRAGGWCIQPFSKLKNALKKHNIWLDSTVFENGYNKSKTHFFDFRHSPQETFWKFEKDPLKEDNSGFFTEIPISSHKVSPLFFWKLAFYKKFGSSKYSAFGNGSAAGGSRWDKVRMLTQTTNSVVSIDGYKSSFLETAYKRFMKKEEHKNFVIIGHPKAMSEYSLTQLESFIGKNNKKNFKTFLMEFIDEK